jgi:predicted DCC family thiol-disulfide oxidoreductase YuxK
MRTLYVLYDPRCGLCSQVKVWLERQPAYIPLRLLAAGSPEATERFPALKSEEVTVISDTGDVWLGDNAWIICLWALRDYRDWALKLSSPVLLPMARQAFAAISRNRLGLSRILTLRGEQDLQRYLSEVTVPPCQINPQANR